MPITLRSFFWYFIKKQLTVFIFIQFFALAWAIDHTLWPYVIGWLVDKITNYTGDGSNVWSYLASPLIFGAVLWITVEAFFRIGGILQAIAFPKLDADIRMEMFDYVLSHSYKYFGNEFAGSISNKIADMVNGFTRIMHTVISIFVPVIVALAIAITMFAYIQPLFGIILAIWVVIHMAICFYFAKQCDHLANVHSESRSLLMGKIVDAITNHINVRLFARNRFEKQYLKKYQSQEQKKHTASLWVIEKMKIFLGIACFLIACAALNLYMIYSWKMGRISAGDVVYIFNASWNMTIMVWIAGLELPNFFREIGVCRQALTLIQAPHDIKDVPKAKPLIVKDGNIVFENVSFTYGAATAFFENKNIVIKAGEKVGLVGFSGSGKTTFVHLILRYYDLTKGRILIDGQDISQVTLNSLRENIAMIPQDPTLFHRSIAENIQYGKDNANDEDVIRAAELAHADEFINKMPEKYDALVGERGVKLSGGQRQRIAIARAILKNAPILILDEATSALDSVTEKYIQDALETLMEGKTTIVIAHRLSTLSGMDRILVFDQGKVVEEGTHEDLLEMRGHYARLWEMQAGSFLVNEEEEDEEELDEWKE